MTQTRFSHLFGLVLAGGIAFAQPRPPIQQQLTFTPYHASGIYDVGETVGWTVTPGPVMPTYAYKWTIRRNNAVVLKEGKLDLSSGKDTIEVSGDHPEMIYVAVEPYEELHARRRRSGHRRARICRRKHGPQQWPLRGGRRRGACKDRALDAAAGRLRRVLGRQAFGAGQSSDQPGPHARSDRRAGCRLEHVRAGCARVQSARLCRQAGEGREVPALIQLQYAGVTP